MTLVVKEGLDALSNMNEASRTPAGNGWTAVSFAPTPIMSSYLVAFAVGNFSYIEVCVPKKAIGLKRERARRRQRTTLLCACTR